MIQQPADIFRLREREAEIREREGWGELSTRNLLQAIERRRRISLARMIHALGTRQGGEATAKLLARHFGTFEAWRSAMLEAAKDEASDAYRDLTNISQIGSSVAGDIAAFFKEAHNLDALDDLVRQLEIAAGVPPPRPTFPVAGKARGF